MGPPARLITAQAQLAALKERIRKGVEAGVLDRRLAELVEDEERKVEFLLSEE